MNPAPCQHTPGPWRTEPAPHRSHWILGSVPVAIIYDADIAERLCSPSGLKRCKGGERQPNARETWLECQARALGQAAFLVRRAYRKASAA